MKKIKSIEGLRTFGWIGVFLCHFKGAFFPNEVWWTDNTPIRFIYSGNAYVRLLFVISGFVLSYKYFVGKKFDSIYKDVIKRWFRLMPPVLVAELGVYVLMSLGWMKNGEVGSLTGSQDFLGIFNQFSPNLILCLKEALIGTYLNGANGYIGPLWTMVYEYLGVLLVLGTISVFKESYWRYVFYAIFLWVFNGYYNYFIIGMVLCDLYVNTNIPQHLEKNKVHHVLLTLGGYLMLSTISLDDADKFSRIVFGVGIIGLMLGVLSGDLGENILGNKLFIKGGKIAYSAYIVHWPLIEVLSCGLFLMWYEKFSSYNILVWTIFAITFCVVVVVAALIERYIEPIGAKLAKRIV